MKALDTKDIDLALEIMENDNKADLLYEEIHDTAILLIAKQQPVASDLRKIIISLKISTDIERIANICCKYSEINNPYWKRKGEYGGASCNKKKCSTS